MKYLQVGFFDRGLGILTIVLLLLLVWLFYDIKSSVKTGEASFPNGTIIKKEHPRLFKFGIMMKILAGCVCLLAFVKLGFDLLRMLW